MKPSEKREFVSTILAAALIYDKTLSPPVVELYWAACKEISLDRLKAAVERHVKDPERGRFMPRPADIMHFAKPKRSPALAWSEVVEAMEQIGAYQSVQFEDGVTNAVIRTMGGWPAICAEDISTPWVQKEFERRYESFRDSGKELNEPLLGNHAVSNRLSGFLEYVRPPVMIGTGEHMQLTDGNTTE